MSNNNNIADWASLRMHALSLIQSMNTEVKQWTDYNLPDPGITLLETICYAISDLSYRLNYSMEDLLAANPTGNNGIVRQFYSARQALPNAPLTVDDYRRLLMDYPGINNAWLDVNNNRGIYRVFVDTSKTFNDNSDKSDFEQDILTYLTENRNLCETFGSVSCLESAGITGVEISLDLAGDADRQKVEEEVEEKLKSFFSQSVKKQSFTQMKDSGESVADILQGPLPQNGFVPQEELNRTAVEFVDELPSFTFQQDDLESILSDIEGVVDASLVSWGEESTRNALTMQNLPYLSTATINMTRYGLPLEPFEITEGQHLASEDVPSDINITPPQGQYRHISDYATLQNHLPDYYAVGSAGLSPQASESRQAQAKQLRAYLILFDQILCDYFAQSDHIRELLAMQREPKGEEAVQSYYAQKLPPVAWSDDFPEMYSFDVNEEVKESIFSKNAQQKDKLLNHLLALFHEAYNMPWNIYKDITDPQEEQSDQDLFAKYLLAKQIYLNEIVELRAARGQLNILWKTIALKLCIDEQDMAIIDYNSLRVPPIPENRIDPFKIAYADSYYNFRIQVKLPSVFVNQNNDGTLDTSIQAYAKQVLREAIPVHIRFTLLSTEDPTPAAVPRSLA